MKRTLLSRPGSRQPTIAQREGGRSVLRTTGQGGGDERLTQLLLSEKLISSEMSRSKQVTILGQSRRKYTTPESNCELVLTGAGDGNQHVLIEPSDMRIETDSTRFAYEAPTDRNNVIEKYINCVSFSAWLPCHCVMMGLPYFQAKVGPYSETHYSVLICFPLCLFVPALLVGVIMLLRPLKLGGFSLLIKLGLVAQLIVSVVWGFCLEYMEKQSTIWTTSLISISLLGICQAFVLTNVTMITSIFPSKVQGSVLTGCFISAMTSVIIQAIWYFIVDFEDWGGQAL